MVPVAKRPGRPQNPKLAALVDKPPGDLWLPSLARSELAGHAYRYTIVLPLLSGPGEEVFSLHYDLRDVTLLLNARFRGCTSTGDRPPFIGHWVPQGAGDSGVDRSTNLIVYARVSDIVEDFFAQLKVVLKQIGGQEEILIERADVWLTPAANARRQR